MHWALAAFIVGCDDHVIVLLVCPVVAISVFTKGSEESISLACPQRMRIDLGILALSVCCPISELELSPINTAGEPELLCLLDALSDDCQVVLVNAICVV